jgi:hypothetical protein
MARRKKARTARRLAIAVAVILFGTFVVKEILKEELRDIRDSIVSAQNKFQNQFDQSTLSLHILIAQQQLEAAEVKTARSEPHPDYTLSIQQAIADARQAQSQLNVDFDDVSRLIDAIPFRAGELRQLRDQLRTSVQKANETVNTMLDDKPKDDTERFVGAKVAMVTALGQELPIVVLGDLAQKTAQLVQGTIERYIKVCNWTIYVLGLSGLGLGLYAAIAGIKSAES